MIRIRSGTSLLNKVVKQFDQAVADLELAQEQIARQRATILAAARSKNDRNMDREYALERMVDKLRAKVVYLTERLIAWHERRNVAAEGKLYAQEYKLFLAEKRAATVRANIAKLVGAA